LIAWVAALRTYRSNQWWDSRRRSYQKAVGLLERLLEKHRLHCEQKAELRAEIEYLKTVNELHKVTDQGLFNMGEGARAVLHKVLRLHSQSQMTPPNRYRVEMQTKSAITEFREAAYIDLQVLTFWQQVCSFFRSKRRFASRFSYKLTSIAWMVWLGEKKGKQRAGNWLEYVGINTPRK
jgi:hypothetical protein